MPELLFIIPMKAPENAKPRLACVLPAPARERLAMALFKQVLQFLAQHHPNHKILVVTTSITVKSVARNLGAITLDETGNDGLSAAIQQAADWAIANNYKSICVLPADLADPEPRDLQQLLNYPRHSLILAPAHDGGTNCLIASPPDAVKFSYGPASCKSHQNAAQKRGLPCTIAPLGSFAYDIDTSVDLARWKDARLWA